MNKRWKIIGLTIENVILVILVLFIISYSQSLVYTRVVVPLDTNGVPYFHGEDKYVFAWGKPYSPDTSLFGVQIVGLVGMPFQYFPTRYVGATYEVWHIHSRIDVKISEVHSDYIVLLVRPL
jgi:hypothetical protein